MAEPGNPHPEVWEMFWSTEIFTVVNVERGLRLAGAPGQEPSHPLPGQALGKADCIMRNPDMLCFVENSLFLEPQWNLYTLFHLFGFSGKLLLNNPDCT